MSSDSPEYEAELRRSGLGWTYRLRDGEPLDRDEPFARLFSPLYSSRRSALRAAHAEARKDRDDQGPSRVKLNLDDAFFDSHAESPCKPFSRQ